MPFTILQRAIKCCFWFLWNFLVKLDLVLIEVFLVQIIFYLLAVFCELVSIMQLIFGRKQGINSGSFSGVVEVIPILKSNWRLGRLG